MGLFPHVLIFIPTTQHMSWLGLPKIWDVKQYVQANEYASVGIDMDTWKMKS